MTDIEALAEKAEEDVDLMIVADPGTFAEKAEAWLRSQQQYAPDLYEPTEGGKPWAQMIPAPGGYIDVSIAIRRLPDLIKKLQEEE